MNGKEEKTWKRRTSGEEDYKRWINQNDEQRIVGRESEKHTERQRGRERVGEREEARGRGRQKDDLRQAGDRERQIDEFK